MSYVCKNDDFPRAFLPKKGRIRAAPADTQTRSVYLQTMISSFDTKDTSEKEEAVKGDRGGSPKKYCVGVTQQKPSSLPARLYEFSAIIFPPLTATAFSDTLSSFKRSNLSILWL